MVRYFLVKKYIDRISAPISVMDLLNMAVDVGFNLETGLFETGLEPCTREMTPALKQAMDDSSDGDMIAVDELDDGTACLAGEKPAQPDKFESHKPGAENTHAIDLDQAAATGGTVDLEVEWKDGGVGEDALDPEETGIDPNDETAIVEPLKEKEPIEDGTPVQCYMDDDLKDGTVKGHEVAENGEITYKIEIDGETHELSEDDVDA
jgi:hypothetical protein